MSGWAPLPVTVAPQPREFFPGLLSRGDEENGFPSGGTASMVRRHDSAVRQMGRVSYSVFGTVFDLEAAAGLFATTLPAIVATTYRDDLHRIFGPEVGAMRLGIVGGLRICPLCVRRPARLIRRDTVLPLVHGCVEHGIWLRRRCICGAPLQLFSRGDPFTCASCGRDWGELTRQPLGPRDWLRQRRVVHAYDVIFKRAGPDLIGVARRVLAHDEGPRWGHGWCLADDPAISERATKARYVKSLASIVANLVMREIPPERLFEQAMIGPHPDLVCHDRTCQTFGTSESIRISAHRSNGVESYCAECGSRFLGGRTILSFDLDNGSPDLSPIVVLRGQARLTDYAMRLAEAARFLSENRANVEIDEVFHTAGVPLASHLRARRLGLVALVVRHLGRSFRGYAELPEDTLVGPAFANRWCFPQARAHFARETGPLVLRSSRTSGSPH